MTMIHGEATEEIEEIKDVPGFISGLPKKAVRTWQEY